MLFFNPYLIAAAVIPAVFLLVQVNKADRLEKEPTKLLRTLVLRGVVSTFLALITEIIGSAILDAVYPQGGFLYEVLMNFLVVGLSEEGFKYWYLKKHTWNNPEFNCQFDGVVYAVFVSLGFALWENMKYVYSYGLVTAAVRAVTAVPGHACFGVFMGVYYGIAKRHDYAGRTHRSKLCRIAAVTVPVLLHGTYDFIAGNEAGGIGWIFILFVAVLFLSANALVKHFSRKDRYITGWNGYIWKGSNEA